MAEDWALDVRKYAPGADGDVIAGIVRHCGIALRSRDASLVSFGDPKETGRVRDGFCRKKLALTDSDAVLDAAIAAVGKRMSDTSFRNRVTVYYLLADHFGKLELFRKPAAAKPAAAKAVAAVPPVAAPAPAPAPEPSPVLPLMDAPVMAPPPAPVPPAPAPVAAVMPQPAPAAPLAAGGPAVVSKSVPGYSGLAPWFGLLLLVGGGIGLYLWIGA